MKMSVMTQGKPTKKVVVQDKNEFEEHLKNCLSKMLPVHQSEKGELSYNYHICSTEQMDFKTTICHLNYNFLLP